MSEIEINTYSLRDLKYFRVYCRYCGAQNTFWDQVRHKKGCRFAAAFVQEFEDRRREHAAVLATAPRADR